MRSIVNLDFKIAIFIDIDVKNTETMSTLETETTTGLSPPTPMTTIFTGD